jgi:hypothetical protein
MNNRFRDIPKSRAFTQGFKLFSGLGAVALFAALLTGVQTCKPDFVDWSYPPLQCTGDQGLVDSVLGPITLGWKGGIGDHFIFAVFVGFAAVAFVLAGFLTAFRDADPRSVAEAAATPVAPPVNPPSVPSYWPALAALAVAMIAIGLVANPATFVAGVVILAISFLMWTVRTWAEHATGSDRVNEEVRERIAFGLEVPLLAVVVIGAVAVSMSRVFLTVDRIGAVVVAGIVAFVFFALGVAIAYVPKIGRNLVAIIVLVGAVLVIGSGVVSTAVGERDFEHHEAEEGSETSEAGTGN